MILFMQMARWQEVGTLKYFFQPFMNSHALTLHVMNSDPGLIRNPDY